jgi:hypothetical protein
MYCRLNPEISASCSCVRPFSCLIRLLPPAVSQTNSKAGQKISFEAQKKKG